ncbi:MAG: hypothetical protein GX410_02445 [Elusimicrobia bacterium]|nr:hypothetical protein [Elusimicrobiota bacterium]
MGTSTNIVLGLQAENTLKAGAYGAAESDAADLGFIKGGVSIEHSETHHEVKVDQALGAVDRVPTDESMKIKVTLAEATLSNLALAYGYGADAVSGGAFRFGSKTGLSPRTLYINVRGAGGGTRKYTFWKCVPSGKTTQAYKRDGETVADIEFEALADTSKNAAQRFGQVCDSGADSTPPALAMTAPASGGSLSAGSAAALLLTITEAGLMDEGSLAYGRTVFVLKEGGGSAASSAVAGALAYSAADKTLTFTPQSAWSAGNYTVTATPGVRDLAGNPLAQQYFGYFTVS